MADEKKEKVKVKKPTALKRDEQSLKRNLNNRAFKSKVTSAMRYFEEALTKKDAVSIQSRLSDVYSLMDKGVKKGIFKTNKASRAKSRLQVRARNVSV